MWVENCLNSVRYFFLVFTEITTLQIYLEYILYNLNIYIFK